MTRNARTMKEPAAVAIAAALCAVAVPRSAGAFERQWHIGVAGGIATLKGAEAAPVLGLHGAYGLSDMFDVDVELAGSRHGETPRTTVLSAAGGLAYKIDIFDWVPYVTLLGGYYSFGGARGPNGLSGGEFGTSVGFGLDYVASRHVAVGGQLRGHAFFTGPSFPWFPYFTAMLQGEYRWGW